VRAAPQLLQGPFQHGGGRHSGLMASHRFGFSCTTLFRHRGAVSSSSAVPAPGLTRHRALHALDCCSVHVQMGARRQLVRLNGGQRAASAAG
jgi:hypothetical protein